MGEELTIPFDVFTSIKELVQRDLKVLVVLDNVFVSSDFLAFLKINIMPIIYEGADRLRGAKNGQTDSMEYVCLSS